MTVLRVGLTGGVASGKSAVAAALAGRGAAVVDADVVVEDLYRPAMPGTAAVLELFGPGMLDAEGGVDRRALASRVLGDPPARRRLEAAVHPLVRNALDAWAESAAGDPRRPQVAVIEAALLVETGSFRDYQRLVVVTAPLAVREKRAQAAGFSLAAFRRLVEAQATDAEREAVADYVLLNDGSLADLHKTAVRLYEILLEDATREATGLPLLPRRLHLASASS